MAPVGAVLWAVFHLWCPTRQALRHFSKLSSALHILLSTTITPRMLCHAEHLLKQFVSSAASLYGEACMRFNMHQLLHLPKAAQQMGPLWAHSAFVFEGGNSSLVKLVTASKGIPLRILERVALSQKLNFFLAAEGLSERLRSFCWGMLGVKRIQSAFFVGGICMLGKEKSTALSSEERKEVTKLCGSCPAIARECTRVAYQEQVYHSAAYTRAVKSNSSAVRTLSGQYYIICRIIVSRFHDKQKCLLLCKEIVTMDGLFPTHIKECFLDPVTEVCAIDMLDADRPCLFITLSAEEKAYICDLPNVIERG